MDLGGAPGCAGAGNPINVITGNKYQREVDLPALPGELGLALVRHYNSVYSRDSAGTTSRVGAFGRGWSLDYDVQLQPVGRRTLQVLRGDGQPLNFVRGLLDASHHVGADPADGDIVPAEGGGHVWRWLDGRRYRFDRQGRLVQISAPTGESLSLQRDPSDGALLKVTDPQGRSLVFNYAPRAQGALAQGLVQSVDTPVGRIEYRYSGASLSEVRYPSADAAHAVHRLYHYEDARWPTLLTGISVQGTGPDGQALRQRIGTYAYDAQGRGNLSVKGEPARLQTGRG